MEIFQEQLHFILIFLNGMKLPNVFSCKDSNGVILKIISHYRLYFSLSIVYAVWLKNVEKRNIFFYMRLCEVIVGEFHH